MNRKEFILKSAGAAAAITASNLLLAGNLLQDETEVYSYYKETEELRGDLKYKVNYEFRLESSVKDNSLQNVLLTIQQESEDGVYNQKGKYKSDVSKLKDKPKEGEGVKLIYSKAFELQEEVDIIGLSNLAVLGKKKYCILFYPETEENPGKIKVLDAKGNQLVEIEKYTFSAESSDCFLSSVCVDYKGLDDQCWELQQLRNLRDNYVRKQPQGNRLVQLYKEQGPKLVDHILLKQNRNEILEQIYQDLVKPTAKIIAQGDCEEALSFYVDFSNTLHGTMP